jgi:uncharacterized membrane protein (DUF2068 family)
VGRATGRALGLRFIGAMKLASGLVLGAGGFGLFRLMNEDWGEALGHLVVRLHLDPDDRLVHGALARLAGLDRTHLEAIGVGTFSYALLHLVEGTGLVLGRRWAEYLTVVATGSLLPLELYEVARKFSVVRVGVMAINLAIVAYVIARLRQEHRPRDDHPGESMTSPPRGGANPTTRR